MVRQLTFVPFVQPSPAGRRSRETEQHGAQPIYTPNSPSAVPFMPCLRDAGKGRVGLLCSLLLGISWQLQPKLSVCHTKVAMISIQGIHLHPNHGSEGLRAKHTSTKYKHTRKFACHHPPCCVCQGTNALWRPRAIRVRRQQTARSRVTLTFPPILGHARLL